MQNVKLIASDMDQTLLTSEGTLPPHFDRYLRRLNQAGIEFVAASGRPLYTLQETFPHFTKQISLVCDNGGLVASHGQIIGIIERYFCHIAGQIPCPVHKLRWYHLITIILHLRTSFRCGF